MESAKGRPNVQGNSSVFDAQYKSPNLNTFDPKEYKNRHLRSQIDLGQESRFEYKNRERAGWAMDSSHHPQRAKDHLYSDIFHTKYGDEAAVQRPAGLQKQPQDIQ
jgi:hypothetical protein